MKTTTIKFEVEITAKIPDDNNSFDAMLQFETETYKRIIGDMYILTGAESGKCGLMAYEEYLNESNGMLTVDNVVEFLMCDEFGIDTYAEYLHYVYMDDDPADR